MGKQEFLTALRRGLAGIPREDLEERVTFYSEMIDDRVEEGLTEAEAVEELGPVEAIVAQVRSEFPPVRPEAEKGKRTFRPWEIALLVLGAPVWVPLLIALFALVLVADAVIWSLTVVLWAIEFSLAACALAGVISAPFLALQGRIPAGAVMLGGGMLCAGLAILGFFGCKQAAKAMFLGTRKLFFGVKSIFTGRGMQK